MSATPSPRPPAVQKEPVDETFDAFVVQAVEDARATTRRLQRMSIGMFAGGMIVAILALLLGFVYDREMLGYTLTPVGLIQVVGSAWAQTRVKVTEDYVNYVKSLLVLTTYHEAMVGLRPAYQPKSPLRGRLQSVQKLLDAMTAGVTMLGTVKASADDEGASSEKKENAAD